MVGSDPVGSGGLPDIYKLFCDYNSIYFDDFLDTCAVSWAEDPLPDRDVSTCDYYPEGGGCVIVLSKSLCEGRDDSDLKNALLHEMIHAYICIKDCNNKHSDHGAKFQKLMKSINLSSTADPHRPVDGYSITTHHEIRKYYYYKCEICEDVFKSIKMSGPSHDDCIEKIGADGLCKNLKCHWHRHKKRCSGSYHKVQESTPDISELKRSKGVCSGLGSSPRDKSNKKIKLSEDVSFDLQTHNSVQEIPKRTRTAVLQNQDCSRRKKRKPSNWDGTYSVVIEWLKYYSVSDSDEDEVPLINKRTERRKRHKVTEITLSTEFSNSVTFAGSTSRSGNGTNNVGSGSPEPGSNSMWAIVPAPGPEEILLPNQAVSNDKVAGEQVGLESASSPLDSPIRGDIIEISDG